VFSLRRRVAGGLLDRDRADAVDTTCGADHESHAASFLARRQRHRRRHRLRVADGRESHR
jgi:hypothetical protein